MGHRYDYFPGVILFFSFLILGCVSPATGVSIPLAVNPSLRKSGKPRVLVSVWWQEIPSPERVVVLCNSEALLSLAINMHVTKYSWRDKQSHSFVSEEAPAHSQSSVIVMLSARRTAVAKSPSAPSLSLHRDQNQYRHTEKPPDDTTHQNTHTGHASPHARAQAMISLIL